MVDDYTDRALADWNAVRPDLDVSPNAVITRILRLASLLDAEFDATVAPFGLSRKGEYDTLAALRRARPGNGMSPTQLAAAALMTTGGMTSRLDRLEKAGLIERRPDPNDRRALLVALTAAGERLVDDIVAASLAKQERFLEPLDESDRATLAHLLRELLVHLGDG